jgi:hypothetical protein
MVEELIKDIRGVFVQASIDWINYNMSEGININGFQSKEYLMFEDVRVSIFKIIDRYEKENK